MLERSGAIHSAWRSISMKRLLPENRLKPNASAPKSIALRASVWLVMPQILTVTPGLARRRFVMIVLSVIGFNHPTGDRFDLLVVREHVNPAVTSAEERAN